MGVSSWSPLGVKGFKTEGFPKQKSMHIVFFRPEWHYTTKMTTCTLDINKFFSITLCLLNAPCLEPLQNDKNVHSRRILWERILCLFPSLVSCRSKTNHLLCSSSSRRIFKVAVAAKFLSSKLFNKSQS